MKEPVVIKSYQLNGFKLVMEPSVSFEEILVSLEERLKKSGKFFKNIPKGLLFEGRELSLEEQRQILACIRENSDMNIVCVIPISYINISVYTAIKFICCCTIVYLTICCIII